MRYVVQRFQARQEGRDDPDGSGRTEKEQRALQQSLDLIRWG